MAEPPGPAMAVPLCGGDGRVGVFPPCWTGLEGLSELHGLVLHRTGSYTAEFRRRGVGRALMRAVDRHAKEAGLTGVVLDLRAHNEDAIAFYQALGYAPAQWRMWRRLT